MERQNCFKLYNEEERSQLEQLAADYRKFLTDCKTERESVREVVRQAEAAGYRNMEDLMQNGGEQLQQGA